MRVNDISIRLRRVQREKLFSIEYMGYDPQQAMKDYENRVQFQMSRFATRLPSDVIVTTTSRRRKTPSIASWRSIRTIASAT